jgi:hypothetical protein
MWAFAEEKCWDKNSRLNLLSLRVFAETARIFLGFLMNDGQNKNIT